MSVTAVYFEIRSVLVFVDELTSNRSFGLALPQRVALRRRRNLARNCEHLYTPVLVVTLRTLVIRCAWFSILFSAAGRNQGGTILQDLRVRTSERAIFRQRSQDPRVQALQGQAEERAPGR